MLAELQIYTVEGKRISADDGKAYSLSAFKALYKDKIGNGNCSFVSLWFMDRVKATRAEAPMGKDKNKIWTQFELGGHSLSVEFKRPEKSS